MDWQQRSFWSMGSGRIVHANAVGHAMLAEGSTVCPTGGKLRGDRSQRQPSAP
jgi:hypothetical protein